MGYRHVAAHLAGEYDEVEMIRLFKRDTRRFAKRQMTWFRKEPGIHWLSIETGETPEQTARLVVSCIEQFLGNVESGAHSMAMHTAGMGEESV